MKKRQRLEHEIQRRSQAAEKRKSRQSSVLHEEKEKNPTVYLAELQNDIGNVPLLPFVNRSAVDEYFSNHLHVKIGFTGRGEAKVRMSELQSKFAFKHEPVLLLKDDCESTMLSVEKYFKETFASNISTAMGSSTEHFSFEVKEGEDKKEKLEKIKKEVCSIYLKVKDLYDEASRK